MEDARFLENYLWPSGDRLDPSFTYPLPIEGLAKAGEFIIQCEQNDTFSTNIIRTYVNASKGLRLAEVYKNTQNRVTGGFVRLIGTLSVVQAGHPLMFLDAAVRNVDAAKGGMVNTATRVAIHLPQSTPEQNRFLLNQLSEHAKRENIPFEVIQFKGYPSFWGPFWLATSRKSIDLAMIGNLRAAAGASYMKMTSSTPASGEIDLRILREHMIFDAARRESGGFAAMGLSVPPEAQAAFFNVMT